LSLFMHKSIVVGNGAHNAYVSLSWYHWIAIVHFHGGRVKGRLSAIGEKRERSTKIKGRQKKINPESQFQFPSRRSPAVLYASECTEMLAYIDPVDQPSKCPEEFWRLEQPTTVAVVVIQGIIGRRIAEGLIAQGRRR
jgi:hypothetical protein